MGGGCIKGCKDIPGRASSRPGVESCKGLVIGKEGEKTAVAGVG